MSNLSKTITIGHGLTVNRIGLGTNRITDTEQARAVLKRAVELGVNFIDTADVYQDNASETTIGNALSPYPPGVIIATKGGGVRGGQPNNSPKYLRHAIESSVARLKLKTIELYQLHRVNPDVPLEQTMEFLKQMQTEGKIRRIGLSEVTVEQIERARKVAEIVSVQNQFNLEHREHENVLDYCEKNKIVFIPWFPLSRGNISHAAILEDMAKRYQASPQQIVLAWLLRRSPVMLPIPGTLSVEHLEANIAAAGIELDDADFETINGL